MSERDTPFNWERYRKNFVAASEGQQLPSDVKSAADLEDAFIMALHACDTAEKMAEVTEAMGILARRFECAPG